MLFARRARLGTSQFKSNPESLSLTLLLKKGANPLQGAFHLLVRQAVNSLCVAWFLWAK